MSSPKATTSSATLFFLELLREAEERALRVRRGVVERRADKHDLALPQVLVLAVLERELRDHNRRLDRRRTAEVRRDLVDGFEDVVSSLVCVASTSGLRADDITHSHIHT